MEVKYPTSWRPLLRDAVKTSQDFSQEQEKDKPVIKAKSFVLFVRLPTWKIKAGDSRSDSSKYGELSVPEIRTLRNISNGTEISAIKVILELSCGIPAHIITLVDVKENKLDDKTRLELGKNINNAATLCIKISPQWDNVVRAAWLGNNKELLHAIPKLGKFQGQSWNDVKTNEDISLREDAFCALFVASARGNTKICETILKSDFDPNQNSILGNTAVHCAAFHSQIEVIKLLVAYGTNIRVRNIKNKSALDIAVSCGFIDCARWLWLNQWSLSITRSESPQHFSNVTKPTLLQQQNVEEVQHKPPSPPAKKFFQKSNQDFVLEKSWQKFNKEHQPKRPTSSTVNQTKLLNDVKLRQRPKSSIHYERKILNYQQNAKKQNDPKLPPQITRLPTRSIPSKYNSRMQSVGNGRDDFHFQVKLSEQQERRSQLLKQSLQLKHHLFHVKTPTPIKPIKINQTSEIHSKIQPKLSETTSTFKKQTEDLQLHQLHASVTNLYLLDEKVTTVSNPLVPLKQVTPSVLKPVLVREQPNPEYIDVIKDISSCKSVVTMQHIYSKSDTSTSVNSINSEPRKYVPPKTAPERKRILKEKPKHTIDLESFQKAQKERYEELRRQKNEKAFTEWMAAKQRQRKSKEIQNENESYQYGVRQKWGKTFDEWLESKNVQQQSKEEIAAKDTNQKRNKSHRNGKTFQEWVKEKQEHDKLPEKNVDTKDQDETELKILRERKFSIWVEKKDEELRIERRKSKILEQEKFSDIKDDYDSWKSQNKVLSFDEWLKRKENEKRLNEIDQAQQESNEDLDVWMEMNRKMKAESAFQKWLLRKESLSLEQAERELEDAKYLRERAERKAKLRRALRKAKMMLKWRQIQSGDASKTDLSELIHRIKHQQEGNSSSESDSDDNEHPQEKQESVNILYNISISGNFKVTGEAEENKDNTVDDANQDLPPSGNPVNEVTEPKSMDIQNTVRSNYIETHDLHGVNDAPKLKEIPIPDFLQIATKMRKKKNKRTRSRKKGNSKEIHTNQQPKPLVKKPKITKQSIVDSPKNLKLQITKPVNHQENKNTIEGKSVIKFKPVPIKKDSSNEIKQKTIVVHPINKQGHKILKHWQDNLSINKETKNNDNLAIVTKNTAVKPDKANNDLVGLKPSDNKMAEVQNQSNHKERVLQTKPTLPASLQLNQNIHAKGNVFNRNVNPYSQVMSVEKIKNNSNKRPKSGISTSKHQKLKKEISILLDEAKEKETIPVDKENAVNLSTIESDSVKKESSITNMSIIETSDAKTNLQGHKSDLVMNNDISFSNKKEMVTDEDVNLKSVKHVITLPNINDDLQNLNKYVSEPNSSTLNALVN